MFLRRSFKIKLMLVPVLTAAAAVIILALPFYTGGGKQPARTAAKYSEGQEIPPEALQNAVPLGPGRKLDLDGTYHLFFSNVPEMPVNEGILCRADDVLSPSGMVRVLFSHMNLLIDWSSDPLSNLPATAGFAVENFTRRDLEVFAVRGAMGVNRDTGGKYLFSEDAAPVRPGETEPLYFGSAVGNEVVRKWFLSEESPPVLLGRAAPGGRLVVSGEVGPRGWIVGLYDLQFVEAGSGRILGRGDLTPGESVGIKTFLAPLGSDMESFLSRPEMREGVLPLRDNDLLNMRGLFTPGVFPDNPSGEAVSKRLAVDYDSGGGKAVSFALAAGEKDQGRDPGAECYVPDVFENDCLRNGYDPYSKKKAVNGGNYGVDYTVHLNITGPAALVVQGATHPEMRGQEAYIDLYNQILTVWIDGRAATHQIKDPNYHLFHRDFKALRPPGYGRVVAVFNSQGGHHHLMRFTLPPNGYGPVRFYLLPM